MAPKFETPPGATPIGDLSGLIPDGILTYTDLCTAEAENILDAVNRHFGRLKNVRREWFLEEYIRRVHRDMFGEVWEWAGTYRNSGTNIGVSPHRIRDEIGKLCGDVQFWNRQKKNGLTTIERAVRIHHRLAWIHPFPNGNGRHARMMADIYLHSMKQPIPIWPSSEMSADGQARERYLAALRKADNGDFKPLTAYTALYLPKV